MTGEIHGDVLLGAGLLGLAYAVAWARGPRGGAGAPVRFFAGLGALVAALNGPLHDLSDYYLFSAHMVQHLLLTLVVAPLLLSGTPGFMLDRLIGPLRRWVLGRFVLRVATRPLPALALYSVALIAWHLPGPYEAALVRHGCHVGAGVVAGALRVRARAAAPLRRADPLPLRVRDPDDRRRLDDHGRRARALPVLRGRAAALGARAARRPAARRPHHVGPGRLHPARGVHRGLLPVGRRRARRGTLARRKTSAMIEPTRS